MGIAYNNSIVRDGLVLHLDAANPKSYPGSGTTWFDLSGQGSNGTILNGVGYSSENNGLFNFDGVNDYISVSNFNINSFTICAFIKLNTLNRFHGIFGQASSIWSNLSVAFRVINDNSLNLALSASGNTSTYSEISSSIKLTNNTWYFVCSTFSKPERKLYINGSLTESYIDFGLTDFNYDLFQSTSNIILGGYAYGSGLSYLLSGSMPNIFYYNRALSDKEIQKNFNAMRDRYGI